ncbi:MAG: glycosyltransferase family 4 protein [Candidatus Verstraetearchaeota archaeon]|nr:glycosyltransferase family 4 protein [Candidatus Verstraetearchaeota archaeon]
MKILYASQSFLPSTGGVSYYLAWLGRRLKELGHEVVFVNMKPPRGKAIESIAGFKVFRVPAEGEFGKETLQGYTEFKEIVLKVFHNKKVPLETFYNKHLYGFNDYIKVNEAFHKRILEVIRSEDPDIIHVHDFQLLSSVALLKGIHLPLVFTWHIPFTEEIHHDWREFVIRHISHCASSVFSTKHYVSAAIKSGIPFDRVTVIPPFIDVEEPKLSFREKFGIGWDEKLIICVARIDRFKGQDILLEAAAKLDFRYRLVFIGNGSFSKDILRVKDKEEYRSELRERANQPIYGGRVILAGAIDRELLMAAYKECDLVVLPSLHEGFGLAISEGMAFGKPVIGTAVGGIPSQIWPGINGYLVRPNDPGSLAGAIKHIIKNPILAEEMGRRSKEIYEKHFSTKRGADDHIQLYSNILKYGSGSGD